MKIQEAFRRHCMANSGVTDLIGTSFYWIGLINAEPSSSYAVLRRASDRIEDVSLSGGGTLGIAAIEVTSYSTTPDIAQNIADAIAAAVVADGYTMGTGVTVQRCQQTDEYDLPWMECLEVGAFGIRSTYEITYTV